MQLVLYNNLSDKRQINKNITELSTVEIKLKNDGEIIKPTIILSAGFLPPAANYAYISDLHRYYFIDGQKIIPGNQLELSLSVDVLMSWKSAILNSSVIAERTSNKYNKYIPDKIPMLSRQNNIFKAFTPYQGAYAFDSGAITAETPCILLTVVKGANQ